MAGQLANGLLQQNIPVSEEQAAGVTITPKDGFSIDYITPIENVALTAKKDALPMLLRLGLTTEETKRNVMKLSGGQQQRVAIARSLAYHHMRQSAVSTGRLGDPITEITWIAGLSFPDLPHSGKRKNCGL